MVPGKELGVGVTSHSDPDARRPTLVRAFAIAPLAAPVAYVAVVLVVEVVRGPMPSLRSIGMVVAAISAIGIPLAYAAALLGALPLYLVLRRAGLANRWTSLAAGVAIGAIVALLLAPSLRGDLFSIPFPWWLGALAGLACAETFWRLVTSSSRRLQPGIVDRGNTDSTSS